jgi:hypothetical protein
MNNALTSPSAACRCSHCPGSGCACGCQPLPANPALNAAGPACACGGRCGCDAAEQGCVCSAGTSA